jgi:hypothetical protein
LLLALPLLLLLLLLLLPHSLQELAPELWVRFVSTQCCTCAGAASVVLNAPSHHAHVHRLHNHHHPSRTQQPLHCSRHLLRDPLLHLQPLGVAPHQLQHLCVTQRLLLLLILFATCAAAAAAAGRRQEILDVQCAMERQHVMLTLRHECHMVLDLLPLLLLLL